MRMLHLDHVLVLQVFCLFSAKRLPSSWNSLQVLVDAECTHDGSIKHIQKFEQWGWKTLSRRVLDAERTDDLTVLQVCFLFYLPYYSLIGHNFTLCHFWCLFLVYSFSDRNSGYQYFVLVCLDYDIILVFCCYFKHLHTILAWVTCDISCFVHYSFRSVKH